MIKVTILDAQKLAQQQVGSHMAAGSLGGANIESMVRDQVADHLRDSMSSRGIHVTIETKGSQGIEITVDDATQAAWNQSIFAWMLAKVMPSSVEHSIAPSVSDQLEEQGIEAEVDVE